ncbi:hypothetical protein PR001_g20670 [Phytophthora rubi]|uniref:Uncharacterized protein n=1 Tax=Phytophthora rubi TaxID=129364 RepID=A0A6A3IY02_9STRA|nr:hypothetical protein PR002_g21921 [Phytophthora rubi]KAE8993446.1 hypothetical protein PR001_g20670 [Phytophthora rubi]
MSSIRCLLAFGGTCLVSGMTTNLSKACSKAGPVRSLWVAPRIGFHSEANLPAMLSSLGNASPLIG